MKILIKGGRVIDPARNFDERCDVALAAGRVIGVQNIPKDFSPNRVLDAGGCSVTPGGVDLAVEAVEDDAGG